ncbi:putative inactive purple acid phosphatase 28 isoform X1 [Cinnamomum micranthum f. kanehirae]|uniref:Putative inactive purple acid phosphatase 28 isoform X1 n=1 Tax=Cinnamomum micranthum f. kanehirae TaxID=337451 RepID=A0A3S3PYF8_9MAGN|nr:putative inactive purple acid phosphatase 28 isoform X1 [Cinnamomum micranthum f. kanehirae]
MASATESSLHLLIYFIFLFFSLSFFDSIFHKLMPGNEPPVKIKKSPDLPLRFRYDGTFKILQIADVHYGNGITTRCRDVMASEFLYCSDMNTTRFIKRLIEAEKPDFLAFTGDNIFGPSTSDAAESLIGAFRPAIESRIPWAAILGNHDQESSMTRVELMSFISLMDYSVAQINPFVSYLSKAKEMYEHIDGFGNYNIQVNGALGSELANTSILDLYFLDSGDRETVGGIRTYGWIKESQLRWLWSISEGFQGKILSTDLSSHISPALVFFHIPIPEVRQLWYKEIVGQFQEAVACSFVNAGVLQTLVSMGDVKAVFMGHDHTNDFCGEMEGIWFCYGGGVGYHGYGKVGWPRRARVILAELESGQKAWMGVERIKTWKRLDDENLSRIDEQVLWVKQTPNRSR